MVFRDMSVLVFCDRLCVLFSMIRAVSCIADEMINEIDVVVIMVMLCSYCSCLIQYEWRYAHYKHL